MKDKYRVKGRKKMKWDAALYEQFGKERIQPTLDLINRIPEGNYKRIIDVGCGSGMSTLPLEQRFTEAEILGVDYSKEMLEHAKQTSQKITWIQRDCSQSLADLGKFDLIFSNAFLQWIPNQEDFIAEMRTLLNTQGVFALQVPNYDHMPIKQCIDQVASQFENLSERAEKRLCHNKSLAEYYDMLGRYFKEITIWETHYAHVMASYEAIIQFMSSTGIRPYLEMLNEEKQQEFIKKLMEELKKTYPIQENGKILFTFERIEWVTR